ncbi:MAG: ABC transporter permease [Kiritimatiellae bacterium]|nr:ABC transporter permease [Kiritimatiellia bacterium]
MHHAQATPPRETLAEVWRWRFAIANLMRADFCARYRNMSLGVAWSLLNPLVLLGMFAFVFTYGVQGVHRPYFPVFLLLGIVPYNFFSLSLAAATPSLQFNAAIVKRVPFPRVLLPVATVCSQALHFAVQLALLGLFVLFWRVPPTAHWLWLPLLAGLELAWVAGAATLACMLNVRVRDMRYLVESGLVVLFWLTPVFYSADAVRLRAPRWLWHVYSMNPLVGIIEGARRAVLDGRPPDFSTLSVAATVTALTLATASLAARWIGPTCADEL